MTTRKDEYEQRQIAETGEQSLSDRYAAMADDYLNRYANERFSYDQNLDPVYQQARDTYLREGRRAAENTAALAAAYSGGYGNSYGTATAQQQMNAAIADLNAIVPELEQNAYSRWSADRNRDLTLAQLYADRGDQAYNRAWNEASLAAQYGDYGGLNGLGIDTSGYEARQAADYAWTDAQRERQRAEWEQADEDRKLQIALQWAQQGDPSLLRAMGLDTTYLNALQAADLAQARYQAAQYGQSLSQLYAGGGGYSGGSGGGSGRRSGGGSGSYSGGGAAAPAAAPTKKEVPDTEYAKYILDDARRQQREGPDALPGMTEDERKRRASGGARGTKVRMTK